MNKILHDVWIFILSFGLGLLVHWVPITTFLVGIVIGFLIAKIYYKKDSSKTTQFFKGVVSTIVVLIWTLSVLVDITEGSTNTPFILHIFMGSVLGALNHEFGDWLMKFINRNGKN